MHRIPFCIIGAFALAACGSTTEPGAVTHARKLTIGADTTLLVDEGLALHPALADDQGASLPISTIAWRSSDSTVASVDVTGRVSARALGTAVITAVADSTIAHVDVIVAPQFVQLATGAMHACGITGRGELVCWGTALLGALGPAPSALDCSTRFGDGAICSSVPVRSSSLRPTAVVAGELHTCALDGAGTAYCWGGNVYGQLGKGGTTSTATPTPVAGGLTFSQLVAGRMHTCGITVAGDAYCWGKDWAGELGAGDVSAERCAYGSVDPCSSTPRLVVGGHKWSHLAAAENVSCGVTTAGEAYCWGLGAGASDGLYCQSASGAGGCTRTPVRVAAARSYRTSAIGNAHRCHLATDGGVDCWGANFWGMFGDGTQTSSDTVVRAAKGAVFSSLVSTRGSSCGLSSVNGYVACWGHGVQGQIGNGSSDDALVPVQISSNQHFTRLVSNGASDFVCAISAAGYAYCWGWGDYGQLGNGGFATSSTPTLVRLVETSPAQ